MSDNAAFITDWPSLPELFFTVVVIAAALVIVVFLAVKGEEVDKPNRMAQVYGYTVCLITLIVSLVSLSSILNAMFDRANPLQSEFGFGTVLTSFEGYKATYRREQPMFDRNGTAKPDTMSDASLHQQYDAIVKDRIASTQYRTAKSLTTGSIFLVVSLVLFGLHWRVERPLYGAIRRAAVLHAVVTTAARAVPTFNCA